MKRAQSYEDLKPLIELCKTGKLFDVQTWIAAGKPVNPPVPPEKKPRPRSPLQYAIKAGFHSLVQVLLDAGAEIEGTEKYSALNHALDAGHYEIAELLVERGANVKAVDMDAVFHTWQPDIMEYFIEHGAEMEANNALAKAFCSRIRTALRIFKQYKERFPSFQEQANIALRHHCKNGNLQWVSLLLWAGADPFTRGPERLGKIPAWDTPYNAVETAVQWGKLAVLQLKPMRIVPNREQAQGTMRMLCHIRKAEVLRLFLEMGYPANDQENGGSSHIDTLLSELCSLTRGNKEGIDNKSTWEVMKMIELLICHGARWIPEDPTRADRTRRLLLKLKPKYAVEMICHLAEHQACQRALIEQMLRATTFREHVALNWDRILDAVERLPKGNLPAKPET